MIHSTLSKTSVYIFHQYTYWIILQFKKKIPYHFPISSYRFCIPVYLYVQFSTHILCFADWSLPCQNAASGSWLAKRLNYRTVSVYTNVHVQLYQQILFFTLSLFHLMNLQADRERGFNFDAYVFFLPTWKHYFIHVSI